MVMPLQRRDGGGNGSLAADLLGIAVADRISLADLAAAIGRSGEIQHRLGDGRLSGAAVACQGYVNDILGRVLFHLEVPLSALVVKQRARALLCGRRRVHQVKGAPKTGKGRIGSQATVSAAPGPAPAEACAHPVLRLLAVCEKSVNFFVFRYALYNLTNMFYESRPIISQRYKKRKYER